MLRVRVQISLLQQLDFGLYLFLFTREIFFIDQIASPHLSHVSPAEEAVSDGSHRGYRKDNRAESREWFDSPVG